MYVEVLGRMKQKIDWMEDQQKQLLAPVAEEAELHEPGNS
jgi:hypothetical protein